MLSMLDEAIADLRAAAGGSRFELSLVAVAAPPEPSERLLPAPTPVESVEQLLAAADLTESPTERQSLLNVALAGLDRDAASLPSDWAAATRAKAKSALDAELRVDRSYQAMIRRIDGAGRRAGAFRRRAWHQACAREPARRTTRCSAQRRPDAVNAAIAAVEARLDAARRLQLARDRWSLRAPVLRQYAIAMATPLRIFRSLESPLDDIKESGRFEPGRAGARAASGRARAQADGTDRAARRMSRGARPARQRRPSGRQRGADPSQCSRVPATSPAPGTPRRPPRAP